MSNERECYFCKTTLNLHKHHIYAGAFRNKSERFGCWVYLCAPHHNTSNKGVHFDRARDFRLRKECQEAFEKIHGHEKFIKEFKRNYK